MSKEQIEEMIEALKKCSCVYTECEQECSQCSNEELYDETLNHIARTLYEAGYRKQEWISVEERLPSEDERRDEYGELVPFLVCEKYTKYPYRAFYDGTIWGDGLMKIKGITHWMPLPEPPKMKGGAE